MRVACRTEGIARAVPRGCGASSARILVAQASPPCWMGSRTQRGSMAGRRARKQQRVMTNTFADHGLSLLPLSCGFVRGPTLQDSRDRHGLALSSRHGVCCKGIGHEIYWSHPQWNPLPQRAAFKAVSLIGPRLAFVCSRGTRMPSYMGYGKPPRLAKATANLSIVSRVTPETAGRSRPER